MDSFTRFIAALSGFAWPAIILFLGWYFRDSLQAIFLAMRQQVASGAALKWKEFEFRGVDIALFDAREGAYHQELADEKLFSKRHASYAANKNLFLVHRVRPTGAIHKITGLPTFDVSVYLVSHKNFGKMNDVSDVEYYFGQHFGLSQGEYGTKYIVRNGTDGFAVKVNAYGPTLCEARIRFHDGSETTVSRYLDFEGVGYRFRADTNLTDMTKLQAKLED